MTGEHSTPEARTSDLLAFGYAPGNYMFRCHDCSGESVGDKRSLLCKECAEQAMNNSQQSEVVPSKQRCATCDAIMEQQQYPDPNGYAVARYKYVCPKCSTLVPHTAQEIANDLRAIGKGGEGYGLSPAQFKTIERAAAAIEALSLPDETACDDWKFEAIALRSECADKTLEIENLRAALVYSCHAQHGTPLHMLPPGITLYNDDGVKVERDGYRVYAGPSGMREARAMGHDRRPEEPPGE